MLSRREFIKSCTEFYCAIQATRMLGGVRSVRAADGPSTVHAVLGDALSELYDMGKLAAARVGITGNALSGKTVVIKPNLLTIVQEGYDPNKGDCTKGEILAGLAEQCLQAGAQKVTICEGAQAESWDWNEVIFFEGNTVYGTTNLGQAVEYLKTIYGDRIELICLNAENEWYSIPSCSNDSSMLDGLLVAQRFFDADHVLSVAPLKTHTVTKMSASMKNLIGVTPVPYYGLDIRHKLHEAYANATCAHLQNPGIAGCVMDIVKSRKDNGRQDFAIIDCSIGLEGEGPRSGPSGASGSPIDCKERSNIGKYFLLASDDLVAADTIGTQIINYTLEEIKQLVLAQALELGETQDIMISGATLEELLVPDWKKPIIPFEWGVPSTIPRPFHESVRRKSRLLNYAAATFIPAALVHFWRKLHLQHKPPSPPEK